jgi:hypothetical protein
LINFFITFETLKFQSIDHLNLNIMKSIAVCILLVIFVLTLNAQKIKITGVVKDANTGETIIGANVLLKEGIGTVTDLEGKFTIEAENGKYDITISFVGYKPVIKRIEVSGKPVNLTVDLSTQILDEVMVVADIARSRETPVAFTNILPAKIEEELAGQDIPLVLNSTPGVYATQQGGGDGDARITIRGFNQRNVAVMIDGIPVNDMENGWVYWSNWFGLDAVTRTIQVQRGLGASKLAIPSIGGTMNIITQGIEQKAGGSIKQSFGSDGKFQTDFGYNSGKLKNGWGFSLAGSYKQGDGFAEETYSKGYFYYFRIDKSIGNHIITVNGMGAPQEHGQRPFTKYISSFSKNYAANLSKDPNSVDYIDTTNAKDYGLEYNSQWGYLERWTWNQDRTDTIHAAREKYNTAINYYHKPQFSLRDFWTINDKLSISNILYLSLGNGGGTGLYESVSLIDGQQDLQSVYDGNLRKYSFEPGRAGNAIRSSVNNHVWYGFLSTVNYDISDQLTFAGGIDLRSYKGEHYRTIYDMLGGEYFYDVKYGVSDNRSVNQKKYDGDKIGYWNDGLVKWGGVFGNLEYKAGRWSAFVNFSTSLTGYKRIDYFAKKMIVLPDTTLRVGIIQRGSDYLLEQVTYNGKTYNIDSPEAKRAESDWKKLWGFTFKTGFNFNIDEQNNIFINAGYISKAQRFGNVIDNQNKIIRDAENELIKAFEIGYNLKVYSFAVNVNTYITSWDNKPSDGVKTVTIDGEPFGVNILGMGAIHKGIEFDFAYKPIKSLDWQGSVSVGDWKWNSKEDAIIRDDNGNEVAKVSFDAMGVHVGDAAQTQLSSSLRYDITKGLFMKAQVTWFDRYYSEFDPLSLTGVDAGHDSWKIPAYYLIDLNAGYSFKLFGVSCKANFNVINLLDSEYISDAVNNDSYLANNPKSFDAKSASVFMGIGRRYMASLKVNF